MKLRESSMWLWAVAICVACSLGLVAPPAEGGEQKKQLRIAVVPKGLAHVFWQTVHAGAVAAGQELNAKILWKGPAKEIEFAKQIAIVEDSIAKRVDGIVLAATHEEALVRVIHKAAKAKIPLALFDSGAKTDKYVTFAATDNYLGGVKAADEIARLLNGKGRVAIIGVMPGGASTMAREKGFQDHLKEKYPDLKVVAFQYGMSDRAKSMAVTENILTAHPKLDGIFGPNESSAVGALQALRGRRLAGKVKLVGFDSSPTLVEGLERGHIHSLIVQNPFGMGYEGVKAIVDHRAGKTVLKRIDTGVFVVTKANLKTKSIQDIVNPDWKKYLGSI